MSSSKFKTGTILMLATAMFLLPQAANAAFKKVLRYSSVYAQSNYGNGETVAKVRLVREGRFKYWQVKLPGGFWDRCDGDCSETYRRNQLDLWETIDEDSGEGSIIRR